jgi:cytochrome c5
VREADPLSLFLRRPGDRARAAGVHAILTGNRSATDPALERIYFRADLIALFSGSPHAEDIVSKQDTHFFNTFSLVIGLLVAIAIGIFAFARVVARQTQDKDVYEETQYLKTVRQNLAPVAQVAVAGQDNAALAIKPDTTAAAGSAGAGPALPTTGEGLFMQTCSVCHGQGIAGAPKAGDKAAWGPRIAKGKAVLYQHALEGFQGTAGVMPPKGGRTDAPDALVKEAVDYMVGLAK